MPSGAVEHHDGVLVMGQGLGEAVEEDPRRVGVDPGRDQREGGLAAGPGGTEESGPFVAPVLHARRDRQVARRRADRAILDALAGAQRQPGSGERGVEIARDVLAETQAAVQPLAPHLDTRRRMFIAAALAGAAVTICARLDDRRRGRR